MRTRITKRHAGLKVNTWRTLYVTAGIVLTLLLLILTVKNTTEEKVHAQMASENQKILELVKPKPYTEPELAPLPEKEANTNLIKRLWGRDSYIGVAIAKCESGYRTTAQGQNTNGTVDQGVFQINSVHGMPDMLNATANILYGYQMYKDQGTTPWNSSKKCWGGII